MKTDTESPTLAFSRLDTEAYLSRLHELCALDSPTGEAESVDRVAATLAEWARGAGLEVDSFQTSKGAHLRISLTGTGSGRSLLIGHHDTVWPQGEGARRPLWVEGGRAMGPGAADMKGGLLVGLAAMERLAAGGCEGFGAVELHSLPDEEARVGPPERLDLLAGADAAIVLECGRESGAIVGSRDGATWIRLEAHGRGAHAGQDRALGRSALHAAIAETGRIEALGEGRSDLRITTTNLVSDGPENAVAEWARVSFDVRAGSADRLAWAIGEAGRHDAHPGVELSCSKAPGFPPMARDERLVQRALAELARAGAASAEEHAGGASDGCWSSSLGVPTVDGLGPVGGADHTEEEWIDVQSVGPRVEAVVRLCGIVDGGAEGER